MREALRLVANAEIASHLTLAYDAWAPVEMGGKVPDENKKRESWLGELGKISVSQDYAKAFNRWKSGFAGPSDRVFTLRAGSRLLVGHGTGSATDVGLTIHHTWGVPMIPGSALKGLCAHYLDAVYGPDDPAVPAWRQNDTERRPFQGVLRRNGFALSGPGDALRAIFGSPDADDDRDARAGGAQAGASAGFVTFHDALYVPASAPANLPYAPDVLTVHQREYYASSGAVWPNDYDSPNPVSFLTVKPGVEFMFILTGPAEWAELADRILREALSEWGVGGKTSSGYGRFASPIVQAASRPSNKPKYEPGARISVVRVADPKARDRTWLQADDGFGGVAPPGCPPLEMGGTVVVMIGNINAPVGSPPTYNFKMPPAESQQGRDSGKKR